MKRAKASNKADDETRHTLQSWGFTVEDKRPERGYLIIACPACHARWSLAANSTAIGNKLALLNHARSHGPTPIKGAA